MSKAASTISISIFSSPESLRGVLKEVPTECIFEVTHDLHDFPEANLIRICHRNSELRPLMEEFAANGWLVYKIRNGSSFLLHQTQVPKIWHKVNDGSYSLDTNCTVFTLETPAPPESIKGLVVVFSSMANPFDGPGLSRHFERNYRSLNRHIGADIAILRIADLDGVVGGFYLPTSWDPMRAEKIANLVDNTASRLGLPDSRVVLYGASKGGTGALFHSLQSGLRWASVAVDPVVDDRHYEDRYEDSHWTSGRIFPFRKRELFEEAVIHSRQESSWTCVRSAIITSPGSPLQDSVVGVSELMDPASTLLLNVHDPKIRDHPDVSPNCVQTATALINMLSRGLPIGSGIHDI